MASSSRDFTSHAERLLQISSFFQVTEEQQQHVKNKQEEELRAESENFRRKKGPNGEKKGTFIRMDEFDDSDFEKY